MKNSFYNIFYRHAGCFYVYNQVSSALIKVDEELWRNLPLNKLEGTDDDTISQLKKMGIVCNKSLEESDVIVAKNKYNRYSNNTIRMTIMPTMSCNFRCWYCYETHETGVMSKENVQSIIKFAENTIKEHRPKAFILDWFGGEPLICFKNHVYIISKEIKQICMDNNVCFKNMITTNGYYITEEMVEQLKEISLTNYQITLDGAKQFHNITRFSNNEKNSFDKIVKNIILLCENIPNVNMTLRINYTKDNLNTVEEITDSFPNHIRPRINVAMQVVWQQKKELSNSIKLVEEKFDLFKNAGFKVNRDTNHSYSPMVCYTENMQQYVINYDLNIYKCTARDFSNKAFSIGYIDNKGKFIPSPFYYKYYASKAGFENEQCLRCEYLPSCKCICIQKVLENKKNECNKERIREALIYRIKNMINEREQ